VEYKIGPDGKKLSKYGKPIGRRPGQKTGLGRLKDDIWKTYIALGGQKFLYGKCKKDEKFTEKLIWKAIDLLPKEILSQKTEDKNITVKISEEAKSVLDKLNESKKPKLVVNNE